MTETPTPAPTPTPTQERIVVGADGSPASVDALRWADRQARLTGAVLEAVVCWQYPMVFSGAPVMAEIDWRADAETALESAVHQALGDRASGVTRRAVQGHPARVLLDESAEADLLVVGSRGHGGFAGMLLGSISEHVVAHARCPVVVVHAAKG